MQFRYGDDAPWISADAPGVKFISVPITDGAYHLQARQVDAYGRAGEVATLDYVLDREAPMPVVYFRKRPVNTPSELQY